MGIWGFRELTVFAPRSYPTEIRDVKDKRYFATRLREVVRDDGRYSPLHLADARRHATLSASRVSSDIRQRFM